MWFQQLMGFSEESPDQVRRNILVDGEHLVSRVNGARVAFGRLSLPDLAELRAAVPDAADGPRSTLREVVGDVGKRTSLMVAIEEGLLGHGWIAASVLPGIAATVAALLWLVALRGR